MQTTYRLKVTELTDEFIESLKKMYPDKELEIKIKIKEDETAYLSKDPANHEHLLKSIKAIEEGEDLVSIRIEDLENANNI